MQLPVVVTVRRVTVHLVQPLDGSQQRAVLPVPDVIAGAVQNHRLDERNLQRLPDIILARCRPAKASASLLVVGQDSVNPTSVLRRALGIDADRLARIELPREIAIAEARVDAAVSEPAVKDVGRPI